MVLLHDMVSRYVINQWWVRRRGTVLGIGLLFSSILGSGSFPPLINWLIPRFGWRATYPILGLMIMGIMIPVGYLFFRNRPELFGLRPDGNLAPSRRTSDTTDQDPSTKKEEPLEENWSLAEVIRTYTFWLIAIGIGSMDALGTGLTFHIVSIFSDSGLSADLAAGIFFPMAITAALVSPAAGWLVDRYPTKYMLSASLVLMVVSLIMAPFLFTPALALLYGIINGVNGGMTNTIRNTVYANYYGRENLGSISGMTSTIGAFASGLGPMIFGIGRDLAGSYILPLFITALIPGTLAVMVLFLQRPRREA